MLYKSLILGVLFGIGVFAVKSGAGISYCVAGQRKKRAKAGVVLLFALTYFLVFAAAALALEKIDPVRHLTAIQAFIQSGMIVHLVLAGLLAVWGAMLLKKRDDSRSKSRGWLMLAAPCPVCVTVIFFSAGFLITCFPDHGRRVVFALYLAFVLISLAAVGVIHLYRKRQAASPESFLGGTMLLMAVYFFLSVTVMPQFADAEKVYQLAMHRGQTQFHQVSNSGLVSILTAAAFAGGYGFKSKKIRSMT